jgi:hypothetical protein
MRKRIRRCDLQKQSHWEGVLRRWREGGQSVRAFCRAEGLRESAFYFWRRELTRRGPQGNAVNGARFRARPTPPASRSAKPVSPRESPPPSFLPVHLLERGLAEAAYGVEIMLAHGRRVRVQAGFDRQTLADVLAVLEARPC